MWSKASFILAVLQSFSSSPSDSGKQAVPPDSVHHI